MANPALRDPDPRVFFVRAFTVPNPDSIGLVVRKWIQWLAGKSRNVRRSSRWFVRLATALGYLSS